MKRVAPLVRSFLLLPRCQDLLCAFTHAFLSCTEVQAVTYPREVRQHRKLLNYFTTFIVGPVEYSSGGSHFNIHAARLSPTYANRVMWDQINEGTCT